jgi:hypothetical protein
MNVRLKMRSFVFEHKTRKNTVILTAVTKVKAEQELKSRFENHEEYEFKGELPK